MIFCIFHEDPYFSWIHRYAISYFVYWGNRKNERRAKRIRITAYKATKKWQMRINDFWVCVCTYIMDAAGVGCNDCKMQETEWSFLLQSFFILFCVWFSESIQNIYGWLLNKLHTQKFLLIYCFANSTIQSVTDFDKLLLFFCIFYCICTRTE